MTHPSESDSPSDQPLSLSEMARLERDLTRDEVGLVLRDVPLIVLADDDENMRVLAMDTLTSAYKKTGRVEGLSGDPENCFDAAIRLKQGNDLPVVLCEEGRQAREAVKTLCQRRISPGILALDENMIGPTGLEIFEEFHPSIPHGMARILQTDTPPEDIDTYLERGIIDVNPGKLDRDALSPFVQAYLRRNHLADVLSEV